MDAAAVLNQILGLVLAPLLVGVIHRTKAVFGGRVGPPLLQPYHDLWKLLRKGAVYSRTTTWLFRAGPVVGLAAVITALALVPFGGAPAPLAFPGDLVLFAYLLGVMRFSTVLAALDTGSSFEGMGASREVQFSALAEPALLLGLTAVAGESGRLSLSPMYSALSGHTWTEAGPALGLVAAAILVVFLAENARIPVDDPNTHLELTMIHEVMVLDHGGPDLAFILYGSAQKLVVTGSLLVLPLLPPATGNPLLDLAIFVPAIVLLAVVVGVIESVMARLRLARVPLLLLGAGVSSALAAILALAGRA